MRSFAPLAILWVVGLAVSPPGAGAQTPSESLDQNWINVCDTTSTNRFTAFDQRCLEILRSGPGSGNRRSAAAAGNNLGVLAAQGRVGRDEEERLATLDIHSFNLFLTATSDWMDREASAFENEFSSTAQGILVGADYQFPGGSVLGLGLSYSRASADFAAGAGDQDTRILSATAFGTQPITERLQFDSYLTLGWVDIESVRKIDYEIVLFAGQPGEQRIRITGTARGETDALQVAAGAGTSLDLSRGPWAFTPRLRMDYLDRETDPFAETDDVGLAMGYGEQNVRSLTALLGVDASVAIARRWGVLSPSAGVDYVHEFEDDAREISASFVGDENGYILTFETEEPDRDFFLVNGGLSAIMNDGFGVFAEFGAVFGHRFLSEETLAIGLRAEM